MNTVSSDVGLCFSSGAHVHLPSWLNVGATFPAQDWSPIWDGVVGGHCSRQP